MSGSVVRLASAIGAAVVVLGVLLPRRPRPVRPVAPPVAHLGAHGRWSDRLAVVTARTLRLRPPGEVVRQRVRRTAIPLVAALVLAPPLAPLVVLASLLRARQLALRVGTDRRRAVARGLPDAVDLLTLCTSAGLSLPMAHPVVAPHVPPPLGEALQVAATEASSGRARADALADALTPLGERAMGLCHVLVDHLNYGVPLAPALERLSAELRLERRRQAEQDARRVPVRLLAPLVTCVLPAFALLTVVPLLAASLRALPS